MASAGIRVYTNACLVREIGEWYVALLVECASQGLLEGGGGGSPLGKHLGKIIWEIFRHLEEGMHGCGRVYTYIYIYIYIYADA